MKNGSAKRRAKIRKYEGVLDRTPDDSALLTRLGGLLLDEGRRAEAERVLQRSFDLQPEPWTSVYLGACVAELGRDDEACVWYQRALELDPDYEEAEYNLGCQRRFDDPSAAERHFRRAIEIDPEYALAWGQLGHLLLLQGRFEEALAALERSVELDPDEMWHQLCLAVALTWAERLADADRHLRVALRLRHGQPPREDRRCLASSLATDPAPWGRLYRSFLLGQRDDFDAALALFGESGCAPLQTMERALRADQAFWEAMDQDDSQAAQSLVELALELDPEHAFAWEELGQLRYGLAIRIEKEQPASRELTNALAHARDALETALALAPGLPFAHVWLGLVHQLGGAIEAAEIALRRAVQIGDGGVFGAVLGDFLAHIERFDEAEEVFERTLLDFPDCSMTLRDYGRALLHEHHPQADQNHGRALAAFERAVEFEPESAANHQWLAEGLVICGGSPTRAKAHVERSLALRPNHRATLELRDEIDALLEADDG